MGIFGNMFSDSSAPLGSRKNPTNEQKKIRNLQAMAAGSDNEAVAAALDDALNPSTSSNTGGGYISAADLIDGGGPGKSGAVFGSGGGAASDTNNDGYVSKAEAAANPLQQNLISSASNYVAGGGMLGALARGLGGGGSTAPRKRYGTKGITSAQRSALEAKDYTVSPSGVVMSPSGSQVAGANFSGSRVVNSIMNDGELSGESLSFGDAFAAAREKQGGDGGTFTYGGEKFTTNIGVAPKTSLRPKLRSVVAPTYDYDAIQAANIPVGGPLSTIPAYTPAVVSDPYISNVLANQEFGTYGDLQDQQRMSANRQLQSDSNFIDTEDDDLFTPIGARETLGERYKRQRLESPSGIATLPGSYDSVSLGNTAFGRFLNDNVLGDRTQLATGSVGRQDGPEFLRPENLNVPMPVQKRPEGVLPFMENIGRVASESEIAADKRGEIDLTPGNPNRLMFGLAGKLGAENTAKLMAVAAQDMARLNEAMPLGSEITGYGEGSIDPRLADAANIQRNVPTMVGDPNVVAQLAQKAEDSIAAIIEDTTAGLNDRTKKALTSKIMEDGFKGAIFDGKFNTDAFMAQSAQVLGGVAPIVAAGTLNPYLGMAVAGAATAGDVSGLVEQKIRARADAGDFGAINPSQLDAVIQQAKMQTTAPSAALGAAGLGIFGKTKIGGMVGEIIAETVAEPTVAQTAATINEKKVLQDGVAPGGFVDIADADTALLALAGSAPIAAVTPTQPATVEDVGTAPPALSVSNAVAPDATAAANVLSAGIPVPQAAPPVTQASIPITVDPVATEVAPRVEDRAYPIDGIPDAITGRDPTITGGVNVDTNPQAQAAALIRDQGVAPGPVDLTIDDIGVALEGTVTGVGGLPGVDPTTLFPQLGTPVPLAAPELLGFGGPGQQAANRAATDARTADPVVAEKTQEELGTEVDEFGNIVNVAKVPTQTDYANMAAEMAAGSSGVAPTTAEDAAPTQFDKNGYSRPENVSAAIAVMKRDNKNSTSYLQRKLGINYSEAEAINEQLEAEGYVSAPNHVGKRTVLKTEPTTATVNAATDARTAARALAEGAARVEGTGIIDTVGTDLEGVSPDAKADLDLILAGNKSAEISDFIAGGDLNLEIDGKKIDPALMEIEQRIEARYREDKARKDAGAEPKSAGAAAGRSGVTDAILRKNPNYLPFGYDFNLRGDLETKLQDIAFEQGEANRAAGNPELGATDPDAVVVPKTKEDLSRFLIEDLGRFRQYGSTVPTAMDTPQRQLQRQQDNIERARAQRAKTQAEAEYVANMEAFDTSLPVDPTGVASLRNYPTNIPLVDSPAALADRRRAIANRKKAEAVVKSREDISALTSENVDELPPLVSVPAVIPPTRREAKTPVVSPIERGIAAATLPAQQQDAPETVTSVDQIQPPMTLDEMNAKEALMLEGIAYLNSIVGKGGKEPTTSPPVSSKLEDMFSEDIDLPPVGSEAKSPVAPVDSLVPEDIDIDALLAEPKKGIGTLPFAPAVTTTAGKGTYDPFGDFIAEEVNPSDYIPVAQLNDPTANNIAPTTTDAPTDTSTVTAKDKSGIPAAIPAKTTDSDTETAIEDARKKSRLASLKALSTRVAPLKVNAPPGPEDDDRPVPQPAPAITREDDGDTTGGTGTGTGTGVDTVPEQVPVDMTDNDNDDQGCPDGYVRVMVNGAFVCQLIEPEVAVVAAKKKKEKEEPRVVVRPTISPRYRPEAIESNYTPYIPGLGR